MSGQVTEFHRCITLNTYFWFELIVLSLPAQASVGKLECCSTRFHNVQGFKPGKPPFMSVNDYNEVHAGLFFLESVTKTEKDPKTIPPVRELDVTWLRHKIH